MWFQAIFYSVIMVALLTLLGFNKDDTPINWAHRFFPVTMGEYWYLSSFFGFFFAIPFLNMIVFKLDEKGCKRMLIILLLTHSLMNILGDPFRMNNGFTSFWLMCLYCIGVIAKRIKLFDKVKTRNLILTFLLSTAVAFVVFVFLDYDKLCKYTSICLILNGYILVQLFSRIKFKKEDKKLSIINIISFLSPLAFGVYLFHRTYIIYDQYIKLFYRTIMEYDFVIGIFVALGLTFIVFVYGLIIEFLRTKLFKLLRVDKLCSKVGGFLDRSIERIIAKI